MNRPQLDINHNIYMPIDKQDQAEIPPEVDDADYIPGQDDGEAPAKDLEDMTDDELALMLPY
jgi:hypothetical protein